MPKSADKSPVVEPNVSLFGQEISASDRRPRRYSLAWGLLIILSGIILLLNNLGVVPWEFWNHVLVFWPVFIIICGINILLGENFLSRILISLIIVLSFGLIIIYGLDMVNSPLLANIPGNWLQFTRVLGNFIQK